MAARMVWIVVLLLAHCGASASPAPSLYWMSSPNRLGETVMVAGGFAPNVTAQLCGDSQCTSPAPLPLLDQWEHSVKFTMPNCGQNCEIRLCSNGAQDSCSSIPHPNAPDIWWATSLPALSGEVWAGFNPTTGYLSVLPGAQTLVRVFGRSLAFEDGTFNCIGAMDRQTSTTTVLQLNQSYSVPALNATCYEATFDISNSIFMPFYPDAAIVTPYGKAPLPLIVSPSSATEVHVLDVDKEFGGVVAAALAHAAAHGGANIVKLGPHAYHIKDTLLVPNNTALEGAGMETTQLIFSFAEDAKVVSAIIGWHDWAIRHLALTVVSAPAKMPVVWVPPQGRNFSALGLNITMQQNNVSNAFRIEGDGFEIAYSAITQAGVCLWPPESDKTDFQASTTLYFHGALNGYFHDNHLRWQCSAFDMDVTSFVIFEDNLVECTVQGVFPHGNSVSFYDWARHPASIAYSYSHNTQTRIPHTDTQDWAFHETWTTDGPGGWGAAPLKSTSGTTVVLHGDLIPVVNMSGATAVVVSGPGVGQRRTVVQRVALDTITLSAPLDAYVVPGQSIIAVVATVGAKLVTGNSFQWTSVVQLFGTTFTGVFADNNIQNANNAYQYYNGSIDGTMTGFGLCYGKMPQPLFFAEYNGNVLNNSNGITIHDNSPDAACAATFPGPYVRWQVLRGNSIGGIALSDLSTCGAINATNPASADFVVEGNAFACPPGKLLPGGGLNVAAVHSVVSR